MSRPVGSKNRIGAQVKENMVAVFNRLGGTAAMAEWAKENTTEFYRAYFRLAPSEVDMGVTLTDERSLSDAELAVIARGSGSRPAEATPGPDELHGIH
jgi:hypothetical protein